MVTLLLSKTTSSEDNGLVPPDQFPAVFQDALPALFQVFVSACADDASPNATAVRHRTRLNLLVISDFFMIFSPISLNQHYKKGTLEATTKHAKVAKVVSAGGGRENACSLRTLRSVQNSYI